MARLYAFNQDGPLAAYKEYISMLPGMDHPEAFGQHPNADITSQIQETRMMFETLLSLQAAGGSSSASDNREEKVPLNTSLIERVKGGQLFVNEFVDCVEGVGAGSKHRQSDSREHRLRHDRKDTLGRSITTQRCLASRG